MTGKPAFYITTPIYYVNDVPHIGHAYTTIACDVIARFKRLDGYDVLFLTGTDEHGQKVEKSAREAGTDPQTYTDRISQQFRDLAATLNISNDAFIRTTEERHIRASQALWEALDAGGHLYLDSYAGWYSVRDEAFYGEDELVETEAGERLAPSGAPVEWVEEPSYFFRLSAFQDRLLDYYAAHPEFVLPHTRFNEVASFVKSGLRDLSVSRTSFNWGVPVPGDDEHVMYVWLDALTNYLTQVGYPDTTSTDFLRYWPADVHVVGKDILRFHAVYWPAFLMAADLPVPKRIFAHGWLTNRGEKISKSVGNVIRPADVAAEYGLDQMRYFLMREVPFGNDGIISREAMINRINSDLANDFGNLAQRSLSMIAKNCGGTVPQPGELADADIAMLGRFETALEEARQAMDGQAVHDYLAAVWRVVGEGNGYFARQEPWVLRKTDPERMATVLYITAEVVRQCAILAQPAIPDAAARLLDQLGVPPDARRFADLGDAGRLVAGSPLPRPEGVFPRVNHNGRAAS